MGVKCFLRAEKKHDLIDGESIIMIKSKKNILIFAVLYLAYSSIYIARVNLSIAGPELIGNEIINSAQLGYLGSCFFVCYAVGRIINGALSDYVPPKFMLGIGLIAVGIANICISFFPPFWGMAAIWILNACAQSMLWSSVLASVVAVYDKEKVKKKSSAMVTSVAAGNILGIILNTFFITKFGLKYAFLIPGVISAVMGVMTYIATRKIKNLGKSNQKHIPIVSLLKQKEFLKMNVAAVVHGVMKENIGLWMAVYVADIYKVDLASASYYILLIPTIGFVGRIIYPSILKMCRDNENKASLLGFAVCIAASALLCFGKTSVTVSVAALGIIYMAVSVINTSVLSIYPIRYAKTGNTASVSGIMDFSTYFGAGVSSAVYGMVINSFGYTAMFASWAILSAVAAAVVLSVNKRQSA